MAFIRSRPRADGTTAHVVNYVENGRQSTLTFDTDQHATEFLRVLETLGPERARNAYGFTPGAANQDRTGIGPTLTEWVATYIDSLSGIAKSTEYDYRSYLRNDIATAPLGAIPVTLTTGGDVSAWVEDQRDAGSSGKTIANKHSLVHAAFAAAVRAKLITENPAAGTRIARSAKAEMVFLTPDEYPQLRVGFTPYWHPLVDFLVASGARFGEVAALRPCDVNRDRGTVYIGRAMKRTYDSGGYEIGPTKTARSVRTISVSASVLDALNYDNELLFVNTKGGALRVSGWRSNVWYPSVARAGQLGFGKRPRIHDMRHTCASWMIAAGIPLPVIQQHLGHESITTTINLYGHLDRRSADAAAAAIDAALRPPQDTE